MKKMLALSLLSLVLVSCGKQSDLTPRGDVPKGEETNKDAYRFVYNKEIYPTENCYASGLKTTCDKDGTNPIQHAEIHNVNSNGSRVFLKIPKIIKLSDGTTGKNGKLTLSAGKMVGTSGNSYFESAYFCQYESTSKQDFNGEDLKLVSCNDGSYGNSGSNINEDYLEFDSNNTLKALLFETDIQTGSEARVVLEFYELK